MRITAKDIRGRLDTLNYTYKLITNDDELRYVCIKNYYGYDISLAYKNSTGLNTIKSGLTARECYNIICMMIDVLGLVYKKRGIFNE